MNYLSTLLLALGATVNARVRIIVYVLDNLILALITLGGCKIGETISSVCWDLEVSGKPLGKILRPVVDLLLRPLEKDHCQKAYKSYLIITGRISHW